MRHEWRPPPPNPLPQGEGEQLHDSPSPCGRGLGEGASPRDRANAEQLPASDPGGLRLRRRLGRIRQDQAADRPAAAPDADRRQARAHPVPHLHQGRRRRDGGAAAEDARQMGHAGRRGADRANCARSRVEPSDADADRRPARCSRSVLDLPGGMRIGTIHAFCQSLLRRFPLEAALSPHFRLVDDRDAEDALTEARETMLAHASAPTHARRARNAGRASHRRTSSAGTSRRCRRDLPRLRERARAGRRAGGRAAPRARRHRRDARRRSSRSRSNWQAERRAARGGADRATRWARSGAPTARGASSTGSAWRRPSAASTGSTGASEFLTKEGKPRAAERGSSPRR